MILRLVYFTSVALSLMLSAFAIVPAQTGNNDPLKPYTTCTVPGELKIKEVTRRAGKTKYREIDIGGDKQKISVVDGYRVMFAYPDLTYYFANVKIEQSDPASYLKDKELLINQLKHLSATKQETAILFDDKTLINGFEHYGLDRDKIDVGGQVGTHVLFDDPAHLVVTVYLLNQSKAVFLNKRRFESIAEYRELRDDFLKNYSACLRRVADDQH